MLRRLNVRAEIVVSKALLVLDLEDGRGVQHEPADVEEQRANDGELRRVELVRFVKVLVV